MHCTEAKIAIKTACQSGYIVLHGDTMHFVVPCIESNRRNVCHSSHCNCLNVMQDHPDPARTGFPEISDVTTQKQDGLEDKDNFGSVSAS